MGLREREQNVEKFLDHLSLEEAIEFEEFLGEKLLPRCSVCNEARRSMSAQKGENVCYTCCYKGERRLDGIRKKGNRWLLLRSILINKRGGCEKCDEIGTQNGGTIDLVIHHTDRDHNNNHWTNLKVLCEGCHCLAHSDDDDLYKFMSKIFEKKYGFLPTMS